MRFSYIMNIGNYSNREVCQTANYKLVSREHKAEDTCIRLGDVVIGGNAKCFIAGPCAVESQEQILTRGDSLAFIV